LLAALGTPGRMKIYLYIIATYLFMFCMDALSLSCRGYEDKVFIECENSVCTELFFVKEVYSGGGCGRRPVVDLMPEAVKRISDYEIELGNIEENSGIYMLVLNRPFGIKFDYSFEEYHKFRELDLEAKYYFNSLMKVENVTSNKLEGNWREKERIGYRNYILDRIIDWVSLVFSILLLAFSIRCFIKWLHCKKIKYFIVWFVAQVAIFASIFYVNMWAPPMFILVAMVVPIVWLYQIVHFIVQKFKKCHLTKL
jgi:hypothetical protein